MPKNNSASLESERGHNNEADGVLNLKITKEISLSLCTLLLKYIFLELYYSECAGFPANFISKQDL